MLSRASAPAAPHVQLRNKRSFPVAQLTRLNNRHKARLATLLVATSFARIVCSMGRDDPDGFDPVADTVGAGEIFLTLVHLSAPLEGMHRAALAGRRVLAELVSSAGIYGGRVKLDANGKQVWGRQYCGHCRCARRCACFLTSLLRDDRARTPLHHNSARDAGETGRFTMAAGTQRSVT